MITASMLYDLVVCPHRPTMDLRTDPADRDPTHPFVELLWERGNAYEAKVITGLSVPFLDLSAYETDEKERRTAEAMDAGAPLIYAGRIRAADLLGVPDLLRREPAGYVPGDIKSGAGEEGPEDDSRPKPHYAVQLALYVDILERQGRLSERRGFVWDRHGEEVPYDLTAPQGKRGTLWQDYEKALALARGIAAGTTETRPAYAAPCKLCHWYSSCTARLKREDDLTLLPELGREKRDALCGTFPTVKAFAAADVAQHIHKKKTAFPGHARELFFDVETHPMLDLCYLHGFVVRENRDDATERCVQFFADEPTPEAEGEAFRKAWAFLRDHRPCALYYYSPYERTTLAHLARRHPAVCSEDEVRALFDSDDAVDLYHDAVRPHTEWPTLDFSVKTLAEYLGFRWRDPHPSGAASVRWYHDYLARPDPIRKQRILDYNEDDCRAMRVLLDALRLIPRRVTG